MEYINSNKQYIHNKMTEEAQNRINSIAEELSQYTLGGKGAGPKGMCGEIEDFSIHKSITNSKDFYDEVSKVAEAVQSIYSPAKITKSIKKCVSQEGKHPTERIMRYTNYNIWQDGVVTNKRPFHDIAYVSRKIFIIAMVYAGFKYVVRDGFIYFFVKKNSKIEKIKELTIPIDIQIDNILHFKQLLLLDTQPKIDKHYNKCIASAETKIKKIVEKIEKILKN